MIKFLKLLIISLTVIVTYVYAEPLETDWLALMPKQDQQALENMPDLVTHDTEEAPGAFETKGGLKQRDNLPAVMYSKNTVASLEGKLIKLGGYPVPIENDAQGKVTQLFIVPYPGACIHVPPPPPNQIVLINYPKGIQINDIYEPIWVIGKLHIEQVTNELADAVYTMQADNVRLVQESDL
ncbi:DUF3299 domain-containing protein [Entomomonas asaccharolytica]|nr:DUF3299 domain-containing protein [Entomomonas asaccharolytica]